MSFNHLERAADAAAYAGALQADLATLSRELDQFRGASGLAIMRERCRSSEHQLEQIAGRLGALGNEADPGRYPLSDAEHLALDAARDLRARMTESLARYQRAAHRPIGRISPYIPSQDR